MEQEDLKCELVYLQTKKFAMQNAVLEGGMENLQMVLPLIQERRRFVIASLE